MKNPTSRGNETLKVAPKVPKTFQSTRAVDKP